MVTWLTRLPIYLSLLLNVNHATYLASVWYFTEKWVVRYEPEQLSALYLTAKSF